VFAPGHEVSGILATVHIIGRIDDHTLTFTRFATFIGDQPLVEISALDPFRSSSMKAYFASAPA